MTSACCVPTMVAAWPRQDVCFFGPLPAAPAANAISPTSAVASASTISFRMSSYPLAVGWWCYPEDDAGGVLLRCGLRCAALLDQEVVNVGEVLEGRLNVLGIDLRRLGGEGDVAGGEEVGDDVAALVLDDNGVLEVEAAVGQHLPDQPDDLGQRLLGRVGSVLLELRPLALPLVQVETR